MPIYEYRCTSCNHEFEAFQKITDEPVKTCEKCNGAVEKLISQSSFSLKGTGWYKTDYGNGGSAPKSNSSEKKCDAAASECAGCPSAPE